MVTTDINKLFLAMIPIFIIVGGLGYSYFGEKRQIHNNHINESNIPSKSSIEIIKSEWCFEDPEDCHVCGEIINTSNVMHSVTIRYRIIDKNGYQVGIASDYIDSLAPHTKSRFITISGSYCGDGKGRYELISIKVY